MTNHPRTTSPRRKGGIGPGIFCVMVSFCVISGFIYNFARKPWLPFARQGPCNGCAGAINPGAPQPTERWSGTDDFDSVTKSANVTVYPKDKYELAYEAYIREEQRSSQESTRQVVLVKMDSIQKLEKAYPNYFARLKDFQTGLNHVFSWCA